MRRESQKNFRKKNKNENFEQSHSAENSEKRGDTLGFFNTLSVAKYQKIERKTLWGHLKNFEKKSHKAEKSHSAEKSEKLVLRNTCQKISAYPRVRTRNLWVEKQASYH